MLRKAKKGQGLTEFALILPVLLLVVLGIIEAAWLIWSYITVQNAAREAARYAVTGAPLSDQGDPWALDPVCDEENPGDVSCEDFGNDTPVTRARAIKEVALEYATGLPMDVEAIQNEDQFLAEFDTIRAFGVYIRGQVDPDDITGTPDHPGTKGLMVLVRVYYNAPMLDPIYNVLLGGNHVHLNGEVAMQNEGINLALGGEPPVFAPPTADQQASGDTGGPGGGLNYRLEVRYEGVPAGTVPAGSDVQIVLSGHSGSAEYYVCYADALIPQSPILTNASGGATIDYTISLASSTGEKTFSTHEIADCSVDPKATYIVTVIDATTPSIIVNDPGHPTHGWPANHKVPILISGHDPNTTYIIKFDGADMPSPDLTSPDGICRITTGPNKTGTGTCAIPAGISGGGYNLSTAFTTNPFGIEVTNASLLIQGGNLWPDATFLNVILPDHAPEHLYYIYIGKNGNYVQVGSATAGSSGDAEARIFIPAGYEGDYTILTQDSNNPFPPAAGGPPKDRLIASTGVTFYIPTGPEIVVQGGYEWPAGSTMLVTLRKHAPSTTYDVNFADGAVVVPMFTDSTNGDAGIIGEPFVIPDNLESGFYDLTSFIQGSTTVFSATRQIKVNASPFITIEGGDTHAPDETINILLRNHAANSSYEVLLDLDGDTANGAEYLVSSVVTDNNGRATVPYKIPAGISPTGLDPDDVHLVESRRNGQFVADTELYVLVADLQVTAITYPADPQPGVDLPIEISITNNQAITLTNQPFDNDLYVNPPPGVPTYTTYLPPGDDKIWINSIGPSQTIVITSTIRVFNLGTYSLYGRADTSDKVGETIENNNLLNTSMVIACNLPTITDEFDDGSLGSWALSVFGNANNGSGWASLLGPDPNELLAMANLYTVEQAALNLSLPAGLPVVQAQPQPVIAATQDAAPAVMAALPALQPPVTIKINFQPASSSFPVPGFADYYIDTGNSYGVRSAPQGGGYTYGWVNTSNSPTNNFNGSERNTLSDERYDRFVRSQQNGTFNWQFQVPQNGSYTVRLVAGDPDFYNGFFYHFRAEGVNVVNAAPTNGNRFVDGTVTVNVTDGVLNITNGPSGVNNRIAFIEITSTLFPPPPLVPPAACNNSPLTGALTSWTTNQDIGGVNSNNPGYAAQSSDGSQTYVCGSGVDIWDTADSFHYVYKSSSGDGEYIARLTQWTGTVNAWSKGGIMIRSTNAANSRQVLVAATGSNGVQMQYRTSDGGTTQGLSGGTFTTPVWLRLRKVGTQIQAFKSTDPTTDPSSVPWGTAIGTVNIDFGGSFLVGLAVTSHNNNNGQYAQAKFDNVVFSVPVVTPALNAPTGLATSVVGATGSESIALNWTDNSSSPNEDYFVIERSTDNVTFNQIGVTSGANITTYTDNTAVCATSYYYRVKAYRLVSGNPTYSNPSNVPAAVSFACVPPITCSQTNPHLEAGTTQIVIEAEDFASMTAGSGDSWVKITDTNASGNSAVEAVTNDTTNAGNTTTGPYMIYYVHFDTPGNYYVYVRMRAPSGSDDSIHVGLEGVPVTYGGNGLSENVTTSYGWSNLIAGTTNRAVINVAANKVNQVLPFYVWMREDGAVLDKIVLKQTSTPASAYPTGSGPAKSTCAPPVPPYAAPSNLVATQGANTKQAVLTWTDNTSGANQENRFIVERSTDGGTTWSQFTTTSPDVTTYTDSTLVCDEQYAYRVISQKDSPAKTSEPSNVAFIINPCPAPNYNAPTNVQATATRTATGTDYIDVTWNDPNNNEDEFYLYRTNDGGTNWALIAVLPANTVAYTDNGVTCATGYQYRLRTYRLSPERISDYSNTSNTATTGVCPAPTCNNSTETDGQLLLCSSGTGITQANDASGGYLFMHRVVNSLSFDMIVKVNNVSSQTVSSLAGLEVRDSMGSNAKKVNLAIQSGNTGQVAAFNRAADGAAVQNVFGWTNTDGGVPAWLRIVRANGRFYFYYNARIEEVPVVGAWNLLGYVEDTMDNSVEVGLINATGNSARGQSYWSTFRISCVSAPLASECGVVNESDEKAVINAINYTDNFASKTGQDNWLRTQTSSGGYPAMYYNGSNYDGTQNANDANYFSKAPALEYAVNIQRSGTYYLWLLGYSPDDNGDSIHVGIDGLRDNFLVDNTSGSGLRWFYQTFNGQPYAKQLSQGIHTINLWGREDDFQLVQVLLTTLAPGQFTPSPNAPLPQSACMEPVPPEFPPFLEACSGNLLQQTGFEDNEGDRAAWNFVTTAARKTTQSRFSGTWGGELAATDLGGYTPDKAPEMYQNFNMPDWINATTEMRLSLKVATVKTANPDDITGATDFNSPNDRLYLTIRDEDQTALTGQIQIAHGAQNAPVCNNFYCGADSAEPPAENFNIIDGQNLVPQFGGSLQDLQDLGGQGLQVHFFAPNPAQLTPGLPDDDPSRYSSVWWLDEIQLEVCTSQEPPAQQGGKGTVKGQLFVVFGSSQVRVQGVTVWAYAVNPPGPVQTTYSVNSGFGSDNYSFYNLEPGEYIIYAEYVDNAGTAYGVNQSLTVSADQTENLNLYLRVGQVN